MRRRLIDIGIVAIIAAVALLLLRVAALRLFPERLEEGGNRPEGRVSREPISAVPTATMPTPQALGPGRTIVARGEAFGTPWTLAVNSRAGFCVELIRARETTGSCGADGMSVQVIQTDAPAGRTVYFGAVPKRTAQVWMAFQDSRVVKGQVLAVPEKADAPVSLFLLPPVTPDSGEVVAVDGRGLLVGYADVSRSGGAGRPVGVVDAYGNVIGYVPVGDWARPPPGRHATLQDIRHFLLVPLARIHRDVEAWWSNRPAFDAKDRAVRSWWAAYPVRGKPGT
jgi:hypothetical protein